MKYIIDHFEEKFAVCEDPEGRLVDIERSKIPKEAKEGDVLICKNGRFAVDKKQTEKLRREIERLMEEVWED
ncbi:DUF3006 domain-containing protein [Caldibacillus debilis]|uniref:DUF3006 domain-containing protein n=1 Tax=Caldibacillus debilis TaxID=301148 RepID=UPI0003647CDA|nr:DUF3006 domain-containing protein [Caldibacillus debilis]